MVEAEPSETVCELTFIIAKTYFYSPYSRDEDPLTLTGDLGIDWGGQGEDLKGERMGSESAEAHLFRYAEQLIAQKIQHYGTC